MNTPWLLGIPTTLMFCSTSTDVFYLFTFSMLAKIYVHHSTPLHLTSIYFQLSISCSRSSGFSASQTFRGTHRAQISAKTKAFLFVV